MIFIAETKDYELVARLNEEAQNLHHRLHPEIFKPYNKEETVKAMQNFLSDTNCRAYVAIKDNEPIGYIICFVREAAENAFHYTLRSVYIDQVGVLENHRKTGAGKLLMEQAEKLAKEHNIKKLELDHWSANAVAAAYFRKNGYTLYKERLFKVID